MTKGSSTAGQTWIRRRPGVARGGGPLEIRNSALLIMSALGVYDAVMATLRIMLVLIVASLGLVVQGFGMPVMAAEGPASSGTACQALNHDCAGSDHAGKMLPSVCQMPCVAPATLPSQQLTMASITWVLQPFSIAWVDPTSGIGHAPDPFPPKT